MKTVFVKAANQPSLDDVDIPEVNDGEILVRMRSCGVCGSDLEKIYGKYGMSSGRLGHEPAGEIKKIGNSVKGFELGQRVFVHHHVPCYSCHFCLHGESTMCEEYSKSNITPCGLSEYFVVPRWNVERGGVLKIPDNVTFEQAALIEPLACCIRALGRANLQKGDDIAVFGLGPAGMMNIILAKSYGARNIIGIDINKFRLQFASKENDIFALDASTDNNIANKIKSITQGRGVDVAIIATGSHSAIAKSLDITRKGGKVILFGVPPKDATINLDLNLIYSREITIIPSYAATELETNQASKLIASGRIDVDHLITHKFDISNGVEAIKCAHDAVDSMKVVVTCGKDSL